MPAIDVRKPDETPCTSGEALDTPREAFATRAIAITTGGEGSVSNFVFKAVLIRPGLLRQGEKNRLTAPSPG